MESWGQKAIRYRNKAEEMRALAAATKNAAAKEPFLKVAQEYEQLALTADQEASTSRRK